MRRLTAAVAAAAVAVGAAAAHGDDTAPESDERTATIVRAESELAGGETLAALDDFERAASMRHAPDAEIGWVRAALQAGRYRSALAFCAHAAGAHLDAADGSALYAWLLRAGGQAALADRVLRAARERSPADAAVAATQAAFAAALPVASGALLDLPHRMAPWPTMQAGQAAPPATSRLLSGGVLIGDGTLALVPATGLRRPEGARLWARNGLGQTTVARWQPTNAALDALGVGVLRLDASLPLDSSDAFDASEPFAGSPGAVLAYAATARPAWPWMRQGFFGPADPSGGAARPLGFSAGGGPAGAAVFDAGARLVGMTLDPAGGDARWLPAARWRDAMPASPPTRTTQTTPVTQPAPTRRLLAPDAIYEAGLRRALQIVVDDPRLP